MLPQEVFLKFVTTETTSGGSYTSKKNNFFMNSIIIIVVDNFRGWGASQGDIL